ncbi:hypothetical protein HPB50_007034 [Hyalomma asiaticum]|uniref:Uncharacterized protein n=1 Tax=Hyalomma asiaticum TaxID=266040 RepID=A0ACB7SU32_HYAAI|nr:hypothetical protein HPB50_007034 [Hyalomma asiaticum]
MAKSRSKEPLLVKFADGGNKKRTLYKNHEHRMWRDGEGLPYEQGALSQNGGAIPAVTWPDRRGDVHRVLPNCTHGLVVQPTKRLATAGITVRAAATPALGTLLSVDLSPTTERSTAGINKHDCVVSERSPSACTSSNTVSRPPPCALLTSGTEGQRLGPMDTTSGTSTITDVFIMAHRDVTKATRVTGIEPLLCSLSKRPIGRRRDVRSQILWQTVDKHREEPEKLWEYSLTADITERAAEASALFLMDKIANYKKKVALMNENLWVYSKEDAFEATRSKQP